MLKAGNEPKWKGAGNMTDKPDEFPGLTIGRIVHVWIQLPVAELPIVERPAIVTEVLDKERGIIAAHVFKSPKDPPGEIMVQLGDNELEHPLGAELRHAVRHVQLVATWHWPERA
jgi:hypothetical protein